MGKIINKRVPAATIVETVVAMVIILVMFGITTSVLVQTSLHSFSVKKIKAAHIINDYFSKTAEENLFFNEEVAKDGFVVKKEIENYRQNGQVIAITVSVLDNNSDVIQVQKRLFRVK